MYWAEGAHTYPLAGKHPSNNHFYHDSKGSNNISRALNVTEPSVVLHRFILNRKIFDNTQVTWFFYIKLNSNVYTVDDLIL